MSTSMKTDSESECEFEKEEEEEIMVYCDLKNIFWHSSNVNIKMIGVETKNPIIELNGVVIEGAYGFEVGTNAFFELDNLVASTDTIFSTPPSQPYKFLAHASKTIGVNRMLGEDENNEHRSRYGELRESDLLNYQDALDVVGQEDPKLPLTTRLEVLIDSNETNEEEASSDEDDDDDENENENEDGDEDVDL